VKHENARRFTATHQSLTFSRRMAIAGGAQAVVGGLLLGRLGWLSIAQNKHYQLLSESNRVQMIIVPPRRGWIIDRHGRPIAINRSDFRVDLIPDQLENPEATLRMLRHLLDLNVDEVDRIVRELKQARGYQPVEVAENIPFDKYAGVTVRLPELPGVQPMRGFSRYYPDGPAVAHLVGYVGSASAQDYERERNPLLVTPGFKIGKEGLEKTLENRLRGTPGGQRVELTARGKLIRELEPKPDRSGHTVQLTIDAALQQYAARRMGDQSGSIVVIDCRTGGILAFVSMPAYDPNSFSDGIGRTEWKMLSEDDHLPLLNKVTQGLYPPGSTVKPMNSLALLELGVHPREMVFCGGGLRVGNRVFHCWKRGGHGGVNMHRAIEQSCDVYFYEMARRHGYDRWAEMARRVGLGQKFDLPVASQRYGTVPDSAWKMKKYKDKWTVADSVNSSIGQGYVLVNPLQLAVMAARLGSGMAVQPRLLANQKIEAPPLGVSAEHLAVVHEGMSAVVNGNGTAGSARMHVPNVLLAGKTGTAQVRLITAGERASGVLSDHALPFRLRDHSLFQGFAPFDKPLYAVGCILEHSGHIVTAAPIASDVLTFLFDPQLAMRKLLALEQEWGGSLAERNARRSAAFDAAARASTAASASDRTAPTRGPTA
jgi:penicillin-binding protein 2